MRQMADNVAGTRGLGNVSWDYDGHCHRDLLRAKKEGDREGKRGHCSEQGSVLLCCAVPC